VKRVLAYVAVVVIVSSLFVSFVYSFRRPLVGLPIFLGIAGGLFLFLREAARRERAKYARNVDKLRGIAEPRGDAWRKLFEAHGLSHLVKKVEPRVLPAARLVATRAEGTPAVTRLGGAPALPAGMGWPQAGGAPMAFVAQVALSELARVLPSAQSPHGEGHLCFFYSPDAEDESQDKVVIHCAQAGEIAAIPEKLEKENRFHACSVVVEPYEDLPEPDELGRLEQATAEKYIDLREYLSHGGGKTSHKLFGHADLIQPFELDVKEKWRLLLQVDTDDAPGMMWGDAGRLYYWIREADLAALRFEQTRVVAQCY
jgi:uncharacterized protein YwqG